MSSLKAQAHKPRFVQTQDHLVMKIAVERGKQADLSAQVGTRVLREKG